LASSEWEESSGESEKNMIGAIVRFSTDNSISGCYGKTINKLQEQEKDDFREAEVGETKGNQ
jgi:hypothetical protein